MNKDMCDSLDIHEEDTKILTCFEYRESLSLVIPSSIKYLDCSYCTEIRDEDIEHLTNLVKLKCVACYKLSDECIKKFTKLEELDCSQCYKITDECIKTLVGLKKLRSDRCFKITIKII